MTENRGQMTDGRRQSTDDRVIGQRMGVGGNEPVDHNTLQLKGNSSAGL